MLDAQAVCQVVARGRGQHQTRREAAQRGQCPGVATLTTRLTARCACKPTRRCLSQARERSSSPTRNSGVRPGARITAARLVARVSRADRTGNMVAPASAGPPMRVLVMAGRLVWLRILRVQGLVVRQRRGAALVPDHDQRRGTALVAGAAILRVGGGVASSAAVAARRMRFMAWNSGRGK